MTAWVADSSVGQKQSIASVSQRQSIASGMRMRVKRKMPGEESRISPAYSPARAERNARRANASTAKASASTASASGMRAATASARAEPWPSSCIPRIDAAIDQ